MRFYISVDMEGITGIVNLSHVTVKGFDYNRMRKLMTKEVLTVVNELIRQGAEKIVVADSHGMMTNILVEELSEQVELVTGFPRPISMMHSIWEGFDGAIFLGYHAKRTAKSGVLGHTMYRGYRRIIINGKEASEFYINAIVAGYYDVPVIFVSGDSDTCKDAKTTIPEIETVVTKVGINRWSAKTFSISRVEKSLVKGVQRAIKKLKEGKIKPLKVSEIVLELEFASPDHADTAELIPGSLRVDDTTVKFEFEDPLSMYKVIELIALANIGLEYLVRRV